MNDIKIKDNKVWCEVCCIFNPHLGTRILTLQLKYIIADNQINIYVDCHIKIATNSAPFKKI